MSTLTKAITVGIAGYAGFKLVTSFMDGDGGEDTMMQGRQAERPRIENESDTSTSQSGQTPPFVILDGPNRGVDTLMQGSQAQRPRIRDGTPAGIDTREEQASQTAGAGNGTDAGTDTNSDPATVGGGGRGNRPGDETPGVDTSTTSATDDTDTSGFNDAVSDVNRVQSFNDDDNGESDTGSYTDALADVNRVEDANETASEDENDSGEDTEMQGRQAERPRIEDGESNTASEDENDSGSSFRDTTSTGL